MPPKKGTKAYKSEYVTVHLGINMTTFAVESVWQSRDGALSGPNGRGAHADAYRPARSEVSIVFNLTDIQSLPIYMYESHAPRIREELEEKAAAMRAEAEAKKKVEEGSDTLDATGQNRPPA